MSRSLRLCIRFLVLLCPLTGAAWGTTADDICPAAADPCIAVGTVDVTSGSLLDFGPRRFEVTGTLQVEAQPLGFGGGDVTITAGAFVLRNDASITATGPSGLGGSVTVSTSGAIDLGTDASINVSTGDAGSIALTAGGAITANGPLQANAVGPDGDGGEIELTAVGAITLGPRASFSVSGGKLAAGGRIELTTTTGSVTAAGDLLAEGGSFFGGGVIIVNSAGDLTCTGVLDVNGNKDPVGGDGGDVELTAYGNLLLGGTITGRASASGEGASITMASTTGSVTLAGPVSALGGSPDGIGGSLEITAHTTFAQETLAAAIDLSSTGAQSSGGPLTIKAPGGSTLRNVTGRGGLGAGSVEVHADGLVSVLGLIDADGAPSLFPSATVAIVSTAGVSVSGRIHTDGLPGQAGGVLAVQGCSVTLTPTAQLTATGVGGATELRAAGLLNVAGTLTAGAANRLYYREASQPPMVTGTLTPAATVILDPSLPPCGVPTTTTSSTTSTSSSTLTSTTATIPSTSSSSSTSTTSPSSTTTTTSSSTTQTSTTTASTSTSTTATTTTLASTTSTTPTTTTQTTTTAAPASSTSTTIPPAGCTNGDPPACDDQDLCTDDRCTDGACGHEPLQQYGAVDCRLDGLRLEFENAAGHGIPSRGLARRLTARNDKARAVLHKAQAATGRPRRHQLEAVARLTGRLLGTIDRQTRRGRINPAVGTRTRRLAAEALDRLAPLTTRE